MCKAPFEEDCRYVIALTFTEMTAEGGMNTMSQIPRSYRKYRIGWETQTEKSTEVEGCSP